MDSSEPNMVPYFGHPHFGGCPDSTCLLWGGVIWGSKRGQKGVQKGPNALFLGPGGMWGMQGAYSCLNPGFFGSLGIWGSWGSGGPVDPL